MDKKYFKCVIFDLDGTLVDSHETIYRSTLEALKILRVDNDLPHPEFNNMIGFHFRDIFKKFNVMVEDLDLFIKTYKSIYFNYIGFSKLNTGVVDTLDFLRTKNIYTAVLTTKGQDQVELLTEHFKIDHYFDLIRGRIDGEEIKPSPKPLLKILERLKVCPVDAMMVGDAEIDVQCGKNAGTATCAVTFGYRSKEQILIENPDYIINHMTEIINIV